MQKANRFDSLRKDMIANLKSRISAPNVIDAMSRVPRHLFVPEESLDSAYADSPLPIGSGQTISQPYIVTLMTKELDLEPEDKVLEIGTGSGYQAAILAELAKKVITVERIPLMAIKASELLKELGYHNIDVKIATSDLGWEPEAPYDAILVAAASPDVPEALVKQLKENGRMVIPVGSRHQQDLLKITKSQGEIQIKNLCGCRFVALIGKDAWEDEPGSEA